VSWHSWKPWSYRRERLSVLTSKEGRSINESEATTRAARAQTLQPAQGRPTRGALLMEYEFDPEKGPDVRLVMAELLEVLDRSSPNGSSDQLPQFDTTPPLLLKHLPLLNGLIQMGMLRSPSGTGRCSSLTRLLSNPCPTGGEWQSPKSQSGRQDSNLRPSAPKDPRGASQKVGCCVRTGFLTERERH
jgi:hypothetical protein